MLTIVGASVRAAACSAARAGYSVHAADLFTDLDLQRICRAIRVDDYPAGLQAALVGSHSGAWMYTGALENSPTLVEEWARVRPLWGNGAHVLRRVRQPELVTDALRSAGLRCPNVSFDAQRTQHEATWLCKSLRSSGGNQVTRWDSDAGAGRLPSGCFLQEYIDGLPCSAVYVGARGDAVLLGVTRQLVGARWTGALGFGYCGSIGPLILEEAAEADFTRIGSALAGAFELVGLFGVDAILNAEGVWPVEVNPRYTASVEVLERALGIQAIAMHADACTTADLPMRPSGAGPRLCGKAILFAQHALTVPSLDRLADVGGDSPWPTLADLPMPETVVQAGWPILTVLAEGDTQSDVLEALQRRSAEVMTALGR